jgi:hypothetical protein
MISYNPLSNSMGADVSPFVDLSQYKLIEIKNLLEDSLLLTDIIHAF